MIKQIAKMNSKYKNTINVIIGISFIFIGAIGEFKNKEGYNMIDRHTGKVAKSPFWSLIIIGIFFLLPRFIKFMKNKKS